MDENIKKIFPFVRPYKTNVVWNIVFNILLPCLALCLCIIDSDDGCFI